MTGERLLNEVKKNQSNEKQSDESDHAEVNHNQKRSDIDEINEIAHKQWKHYSNKSEENLKFHKIEHETHHVRKDKNGVIIKEKLFKIRNSYLVDLYENPHIQTVYHIFFVCFMIGLTSVFVKDFFGKGEINLGLGVAKKAFSNFNKLFHIWCVLQMMVILIFPLFKFWAMNYNFFKNNNLNLLNKLWNLFWIISTILYQIGLFIVAIYLTITNEIGVVCRFSLLAETARFAMKSHAYIRTNAERVIKGKEKSDNKKIGYSYIGPNFSRFCYFLFCSSLLYRDEYPRTKTIRWKYVIWHFSEVFAVAILFSLIYEPMVEDKFKNTGLVPIKLEDLLVTLLITAIPGILMMVGTFYIILHAWNNAFSELLRFGDRLFYTDWWNTSSFGEYYRQWNIIVHDWLYTYVYKDVYLHIFKGSKIMATIVTITVSAIVHEIIVTFSLGFFLPVQLIFFNIFGLIFAFINSKRFKTLGNLILWLFLMVGSGLMISFYSMEFFARKNCPTPHENYDLLYYVKPVLLSCNKIVLNSNWTLNIY